MVLCLEHDGAKLRQLTFPVGRAIAVRCGAMRHGDGWMVGRRVDGEQVGR